MVMASLLWSASPLARLFRQRTRIAVALALASAVVLPVAAWATYRAATPNEATPLGRLKLGIEKQGLLGHFYAVRLSGYPLAFEVLGAYPIGGVGVGLYPSEVQRQHALLSPALVIGDPFLMSSNVPNQFLNLGAELGWPSLLALVAVFAHAGRVLLSGRRDGWWCDAVSLGTLALVLQLGPGLQNSEAMVFAWLVVGRAARATPVAAAGAQPADPAPPLGARTTSLLLAGVLLLGLAGQARTRPLLSLETAWQRLRWPLNIGMLAPEPGGGRWTAPEATFTVECQAPRLRIRWHAGDELAPDYHGEVSFFVDGVMVERSPAIAGRIRESLLPLPPVAGLKRISIRTTPPFVPARTMGGSDGRRLGVFLHAVVPAAAEPSGGR
jgi:hypothetical protein